MIGNYAEKQGGAINLNNQGLAFMNKMTFQRNQAGIEGGVINLVSGSTMNVLNSYFAGNTAPTGSVMKIVSSSDVSYLR